MIDDRVENQLTWSAKSPLTPLYQRGVKPPFTKREVRWDFGRVSRQS
jgi:hypothetical protein